MFMDVDGFDWLFFDNGLLLVMAFLSEREVEMLCHFKLRRIDVLASVLFLSSTMQSLHV